MQTQTTYPPSPTPPTTTVTTTTGTLPPDDTAWTGSDLNVPLLFGSVLLVVGLIITIVMRRRFENIDR